jgi:hypothetical protein
MESKVSKAQEEVWEWKESLFEELKFVPKDKRLEFIREKVQKNIEQISHPSENPYVAVFKSQQCHHIHYIFIYFVHHPVYPHYPHPLPQVVQAGTCQIPVHHPVNSGSAGAHQRASPFVYQGLCDHRFRGPGIFQV